MQWQSRVSITKVDAERHIAHGWAYVCKVRAGAGEPWQTVVDYSGQTIEPAELRKAAHGFLDSDRAGGVMHKTRGGAIVDSIFFDEALADHFNVHKIGYFIGYRIDDPEVWGRVESGELRAFSIAGAANEVDL